LWVEKYRPKRLDELLGQPHVVEVLKNIARNGLRVHLLFVGPPGTGKTSAAYALANELGIPVKEFNASDERGIQTIRERIKPLATASGSRMILLDEADNLTEDAQQALRRIMERANAYFVLTANNEFGLIDPIKSRCILLRFRRLDTDVIVKRLIEILEAEGVRVGEGDVAKLRRGVEFYGGDFRKILNTVEGAVEGGVLRLDYVGVSSDYENVAKELLARAYKGDILTASKYLEDLLTSDFNPDGLYRVLAESIVKSDLPDVHKLKALSYLSELERGIRLGCDPYVQLMGFLADLMALRYLGVRK